MQDKPHFVTKEGLEKMQGELRYLKNEKKREVAGRIERAKELGDLSENAEYADAKDEMAFVEGRIIELEDAVTRAQVIEHAASGIVQVGSTVVLKNGGREKTYVIVGPSEADPAAGRISNASPVGRALLGKAAGDEAVVQTPRGEARYRIVAIE